MKDLRSVVRSVVRQVPILRPINFVLRKPEWPQSVARPQKPSTLGANYNTGWARTPLARVVRAVTLEAITRPIVRAVASPTIVNADHVADLEGPLIFAGNHNSHLDTSLVLSCLPARFRHHAVVGAGADYFFDKRWKAVISSLFAGVFPIEREKVGRKSANLAAQLINDGWSLVIFPEGTRGNDGWMNPFRGGAAYLSIRCNVAVVPLHIDGSRRIFTPGSHKLRPGNTRVVFGDPLRPEVNENPRRFNERIEAAVAFAADEGRTDWWTARRRAADGTTPSTAGPADVTGWRRAWAVNSSDLKPTPRAWPPL